jgi:splicing factor 3A subunit 1
MAAPNGTSAPADDGDLMGKPPDGVVIPPPGPRENITKTADFIHRKGPTLEDDLRVRSGTNPKFGFLNREDPYHAYFRWYQEQLRLGKGSANRDGKGALAAHDNKPKGPVEPRPFRFSARMPNISAKDLEIVRLTALYTAKNGENWLKALRNREANNYQFEFLRPVHSFFQFFRATVDQYKILLEEESTIEARIEELQQNVQNRFHVLDRAKQRAEYVKFVSAQKQKEEKQKEDEAKEYLSIDWQDFAVIATVTFDEADDAADLPPPAILNDLQSASLEQRAEISLSRRIDEAAPDEQIYYNVSQQQGGYHGYSPAPPMAPPVQPAYQPTPPPSQNYRSPAQQAREEEQERLAREQQAEQERASRAQAAAKTGPNQMRIRTDYVPRAAAKKGNVQLVICPNCKQQIPANEIDEHIRIELLDPRWKEMRDKAEARYSSTIHTVDVANNLKRLASMRDDIYDGATGMPITEEEAARRKKAATSYDGHPDPAKDTARVQAMQNMNVQEQLRRIHEKHGGK